jgi:hypothetical protein
MILDYHEIQTWSKFSLTLWLQLKEKITAPGLEKPRLRPLGIHRDDYVTHLYSQKLALTSSKNSGRSADIIPSRTKATVLY